MRLTCPSCGELHIDEGDFATKEHHTHACQGCGMVWRPAVVPTVGVRFLPGFKNEPEPPFAIRYGWSGWDLNALVPCACQCQLTQGRDRNPHVWPLVRLTRPTTNSP